MNNKEQKVQPTSVSGNSTKPHVLRRLLAYRLIFAFKFFAILDILVMDKFELKAYRKGELKATTRYCKKEIIDAADNGFL